MVHPIFSVLISRPELVVDHVAGYAARRAIAWAVAVLGFGMFLVLTGVAAMLAAMHERFHMALVLVPGIALAISIGAWTVARKRLPEKAFSELKAQLEADAQVLRTIGARS
jgi:hypothetical protein